jgi:hypothetical protein
MLPLVRKIYTRIFPLNRFPQQNDNYFGTPILNGQEGQDVIYELLKTGKPCMVTRFGHAELKALIAFLEINKYNNSSSFQKIIQYVQGRYTSWPEEVKVALNRNAGFFPLEEESLEKYGETYLDAIKNIDILGTWQLENEDVIFKNYFPNAKLVRLNCLEPYYFEKPWTRLLKNKRVLVIHPFSKSIESQFIKHRKNIFSNKCVLPPFELLTQKAVVSNAYNPTSFASWFDALKFMEDEIAVKEFDVALIGAGAYGLPLASFVKKFGRQAVHMGGSLQLLFGIKGARWDNIPKVSAMYNEYWVRPLPEETPGNFKSVEGGCYW